MGNSTKATSSTKQTLSYYLGKSRPYSRLTTRQPMPTLQERVQIQLRQMSSLPSPAQKTMQLTNAPAQTDKPHKNSPLHRRHELTNDLLSVNRRYDHQLLTSFSRTLIWDQRSQTRRKPTPRSSHNRTKSSTSTHSTMTPTKDAGTLTTDFPPQPPTTQDHHPQHKRLSFDRTPTSHLNGKILTITQANLLHTRTPNRGPRKKTSQFKSRQSTSPHSNATKLSSPRSTASFAYRNTNFRNTGREA